VLQHVEDEGVSCQNMFKVHICLDVCCICGTRTSGAQESLVSSCAPDWIPTRGSDGQLCLQSCEVASKATTKAKNGMQVATLAGLRLLSKG
jgi:hypothetical protein